jgi:ABC-type Zn uptake system ZnuABC Zn-binding protein ZnuA
MWNRLTSVILLVAVMVTSCGAQGAGQRATQPGSVKVLAVETFLADIAQNVAGSRLKVDALIPAGADPHEFEPAPADVAKVAASTVVIANGTGLEMFLSKLLDNTGGQHVLIEASAGLQKRAPHEGEAALDDHPQGDPHFWLDPLNVVQYVENIRAGLSKADPEGANTYQANADAYVAKLKELDTWVTAQVQLVPAARRMLVTNHESFGYFADRYGFQIVGTIIPSVSTDASPSAQQLASLVDRVKATGAPAIFLETGSNPSLAEQLARETGVKVVTGLFTHSTSEPSGPAPDYIAMIRYNTTAIVNALK